MILEETSVEKIILNLKVKSVLKLSKFLENYAQSS